MIYNFLFPDKSERSTPSLLLLAARIIFGALLMAHGIQKLNAFETLSTSFPDPLGVGSYLSLCLAIFGELVCSLAFIFGVLYRLAMIPMIFTMGVAFFVAHGGSIEKGELAFAYLVLFILMYIAGAGKFSIDYLIGSLIRRNKK